MQYLTATTAEALQALNRLSGWRKGSLLRYMSYTSGDPPPIELLETEALQGASWEVRSAALFTLRMRYSVKGMDTFVAALRDRSAEVNLTAATAVAQLGSENENAAFFAWIKRRLGRKSRADNMDKHELAAVMLFGCRTRQMELIAERLRSHEHNLDPMEVEQLHMHATGVLEGTDAILGPVDIDAIAEWADEQGKIFASLDSVVLDEDDEAFVRELLNHRPR